MDVVEQVEIFHDQLPHLDSNTHMPRSLSTKGEILLHSIPFLGLQLLSILILDLHYFVIHDYSSHIFSLSFRITFLLHLFT